MTQTKIILTLFLFWTLSSFGQDTLQTSGDRQYYDSSHFSITRGKYVSGEKFLECYEDKQTGLDSWKEYYKNGQLKKEGVMTNGDHLYVGTWKYYSPTGKVDSVINYDKKYSISYFKALEIAEANNFKKSNSEITETIYNNKNYWEVARWTNKSNPSKQGSWEQIAEFILIDKITGQVIRPKDMILTRKVSQ